MSTYVNLAAIISCGLVAQSYGKPRHFFKKVLMRKNKDLCWDKYDSLPLILVCGCLGFPFTIVQPGHNSMIAARFTYVDSGHSATNANANFLEKPVHLFLN